MFKFLLTLAISFISLDATELRQKWIDENYNVIMKSKYQQEKIIEAYKIGGVLIINGETYEHTIPTFGLTESSFTSKMVGDDGMSFGINQFSLIRAREVIKESSYLKELNDLPDDKLTKVLRDNDHVNWVLTGLNFKLNMKKWGYNYSKAVRSHNGYAPNRRIHNRGYYNRFVNNMQVIKRVINTLKKQGRL